ncbi:threonine/serine exporter family protein [Bacillales bacterium AN1005]|uniref:threonine/serine exporter family protein n=1 Tax=Paenibacillus sp. ACRSA TaxID=2918211 RepID=UPI001EF69754|nr:threonine/serine exporter family protein [Paenibacillus sp. ACRSA]MCG7377275.1 threonine/serine exporter family protein [Paenibacillus sp. ACRSA]
MAGNSTTTSEQSRVIATCLLAGKIMLQSGGETYRVEDTMKRMAAALGLPHSHSYVVPTGIFFSVDATEPAKLIRISERTTDLHKVSEVNAISRRIGQGELSAIDAYGLLQQIEGQPSSYSFAVQLTAAALSSGCFTIMFGGGWGDFIPALICGGTGYAAVIAFHRLVLVKFFAELTASFVIGLLAFLLVYLGLGHELDKIIIGSVMPLVPGLLITNAVRDLMAGHLVSGLSKGAEAFLTAFAIGTGIAVVFSLFM